ncbi:tol-pal system-associated acyl-CoA thioesterase [Thiococcus pfennigii]|uniref:tol-pal system-associated acyl-CoA thioesterase n=1 Tax=Thiococcus pfennigii TaxID=1057 RepID=UPI001906D0E4|nr:tol-pal system-associated acyl-CoA thioesterase [Thiococcus pfennigii]
MAQSTPSATFRWPIRVYYEDTDAGGVVYYANYLKFFERARTEWLRSLGFEQDALRRDRGLVFVVRKAAVAYLTPALFNDRLTVSAAIARCGRAGLDFRQEIVRDEDGRCCARAEVSIACVRLDDWRPARIPDELLEKIAQ